MKIRRKEIVTGGMVRSMETDFDRYGEKKHTLIVELSGLSWTSDYQNEYVDGKLSRQQMFYDGTLYRTTDKTYDEHGNVVKIREKTEPYRGAEGYETLTTIENTYDESGRVRRKESIAQDGHHIVTLEYNEKGRLVHRIRHATGEEKFFEYGEDGRQIHSHYFTNGHATGGYDREWTEDGCLCTITWVEPGGSSYVSANERYDADGDIVSDIHYRSGRVETETRFEYYE